MSLGELDRRERLLLAAGGTAIAVTLLMALFDATEALSGWLAAAVFLQALPVGAIVLLLAMRLIPGEWRRELGPPSRLALVLVPLAAAAMIPPLLGMGAIWPWLTAPPDGAFARAWLSPIPFALRTAAWFLLVWVIARRIARRNYTRGFAAGGLIALVIATHVVAADWFMSLYPGFVSSAFGLQLLSLEVYTAPAALVLLGLAGGAPHEPRVMGGLLLTFLLIWLFLQFMPFLVVWSGNLPESVEWYAVRATPGWQASIAAIALLGCVPLVALFFSQVRNRAVPLRWCAASALAGKALEFAWLGLPGRGLFAFLAAALAAIGLSCLAVATLFHARRRQPA